MNTTEDTVDSLLKEVSKLPRTEWSLWNKNERSLIEFARRLGSKLKELSDDNFKLAANQCEGPMVGDERGHSSCAEVEAARLAALVFAEAYYKLYENRTWWEGVYDGRALTQVEVEAELHDYFQLIDSATEVYSHVTGGRVSKVTTLAYVVKALHDDNVTELVEERLREFLKSDGSPQQRLAEVEARLVELAKSQGRPPSGSVLRQVEDLIAAQSRTDG